MPCPKARLFGSRRRMSNSIGPLEGALVAVRRPDQQEHLLAGRHRDAVQRDVAGENAGEHLGGVVVSHHLFDGAGDAVGVGEQPGALVGVPRQERHGIAEHLRGRLVARDDQQEAEADDLGIAQALAVDLGVEQSADEVVTGTGTTPREVLAEVTRQLPARLQACLGDIRLPLLTMQQGVGPSAQLVLIGFRNVHHGADGVHGQLGGEVLDEVARADGEQRLQVLAGQRPDGGLQCCDAPWRERLGDQASQLLLPRGIHGDDHRRSPGAALERDAFGRRVEIPVLDRLPDILEPGQGPEVERGIVVCRRFGAQPRVRRVGVFVDLVCVGIVDQRRRHDADRGTLAVVLPSLAHPYSGASTEDVLQLEMYRV